MCPLLESISNAPFNDSSGKSLRSIAARRIGLAEHRLEALEYDLTLLSSISGLCPRFLLRSAFASIMSSTAIGAVIVALQKLGDCGAITHIIAGATVLQGCSLAEQYALQSKDTTVFDALKPVLKGAATGAAISAFVGFGIETAVAVVACGIVLIDACTMLFTSLERTVNEIKNGSLKQYYEAERSSMIYLKGWKLVSAVIDDIVAEALKIEKETREKVMRQVEVSEQLSKSASKSLQT
jgi:hypothetical protein